MKLQQTATVNLIGGSARGNNKTISNTDVGDPQGTLDATMENILCVISSRFYDLTET